MSCSSLPQTIQHRSYDVSSMNTWTVNTIPPWFDEFEFRKFPKRLIIALANAIKIDRNFFFSFIYFSQNIVYTHSQHSFVFEKIKMKTMDCRTKMQKKKWKIKWTKTMTSNDCNLAIATSIYCWTKIFSCRI